MPSASTYSMVQWSPTVEWTAYLSEEGISMISPDGNTARPLTARRLLAFSFSRDGALVNGIVRNAAAPGWNGRFSRSM